MLTQTITTVKVSCKLHHCHKWHRKRRWETKKVHERRCSIFSMSCPVFLSFCLSGCLSLILNLTLSLSVSLSHGLDLYVNLLVSVSCLSRSIFLSLSLSLSLSLGTWAIVFVPVFIYKVSLLRVHLLLYVQLNSHCFCSCFYLQGEFIACL